MGRPPAEMRETSLSKPVDPQPRCGRGAAPHLGDLGTVLRAGKIRQTCKEMGLHATGGYQQHKCFMRFEDQCGYKYLLNSASIGYANKFKSRPASRPPRGAVRERRLFTARGASRSLLLCGSVVLYVREGMRHKEFYEYGLLPGVHYHAVDTAAEVPAAVKWLREHDEYARAVAAAGRARMSALDEPALTDFVAELLTQYSTRQSFKVAPLPGAAHCRLRGVGCGAAPPHDHRRC